MKTLIISTCSEKLHENEFVKPITDIIQKNFQVQHYTQLKDIEKYDKIIICGTALKDNEYQKNIDKFSWIKNLDKPILGICAGAQIIAKEFGSEIIKNQEIGFVKLDIVKEDLILKNIDLKEVYSLHNYAFKCPKDFKVIAKTKIPHIIKKDNIYGVLFHLESRQKNILINFLNL